MNFIEAAAASLTLVSVGLATVRSAWCWAFGAAAVVCYFIVFLVAQLYANMALQIVYFGLQCYGGFQWAHETGPKSNLPNSLHHVPTGVEDATPRLAHHEHSRIGTVSFYKHQSTIR